MSIIKNEAQLQRGRKEMKERSQTAKVHVSVEEEENIKEGRYTLKKKKKTSYFKDNPFRLNLFTLFYFERASKCFDFHFVLISSRVIKLYLEGETHETCILSHYLIDCGCCF